MAQDILDKLRSYRIGGIALFDLVLALLGMYFLAPYLNISRRSALLLTVPLGVITHLILGQETHLNKLLFMSKNCGAVTLVIGLTYAGLWSLIEDGR